MLTGSVVVVVVDVVVVVVVGVLIVLEAALVLDELCPEPADEAAVHAAVVSAMVTRTSKRAGAAMTRVRAAHGPRRRLGKRSTPSTLPQAESAGAPPRGSPAAPAAPQRLGPVPARRAAAHFDMNGSSASATDGDPISARS